jgi:hypothetical protein
MADEQVIKPHGIDVNIAPYAFQHYAKDFYEAYKKHKEGPKFSPARLFLIGRSIELAAKGLLLRQGRTAKDIANISHNLDAACDAGVLSAYGISLTATEEAELKKANEYYARKGFEYFLFNTPGVALDRSGPQIALSGWPGLPDESILEALLNKLLSPSLLY